MDLFELDLFMLISSLERLLDIILFFIISLFFVLEVYIKIVKYYFYGILNNGIFMEIDELFNILFGNKVLEYKYEIILNVIKENIGFLIDN